MPSAPSPTFPALGSPILLTHDDGFSFMHESEVERSKSKHEISGHYLLMLETQTWFQNALSENQWAKKFQIFIQSCKNEWLTRCGHYSRTINATLQLTSHHGSADDSPGPSPYHPVPVCRHPEYWLLTVQQPRGTTTTAVAAARR